MIDRNPKTPEGDNWTRDEFTFSHYYHPKGKFFANWKSKAIIPAINLAHKMILKGYDMDAYIYDDPRMQKYNDFFKNYIRVNFQDRDYKIDFMNKIVDIILFIMKEDIFYSSRFMDIFNKIPHVELTEDQELNIQKWSRYTEGHASPIPKI